MTSMADTKYRKDYLNGEMKYTLLIICGFLAIIPPCVGTVDSHGQGITINGNIYHVY